MSKPTREYLEVIAAAEKSLVADEYWCISHDEGGPLENTASRNVTVPVLLFCNALNIDWDDAREQGYFLARGIFQHEVTADAMLAARGERNG